MCNAKELFLSLTFNLGAAALFLFHLATSSFSEQYFLIVSRFFEGIQAR